MLPKPFSTAASDIFSTAAPIDCVLHISNTRFSAFCGVSKSSPSGLTTNIITGACRIMASVFHAPAIYCALSGKNGCCASRRLRQTCSSSVSISDRFSIICRRVFTVSSSGRALLSSHTICGSSGTCAKPVFTGVPLKWCSAV